MRLRRGSDLDKELGRLSGPAGEPLLTVRFVLSVVLMVLGIAWLAYYYVVVRPDAIGMRRTMKSKFG